MELENHEEFFCADVFYISNDNIDLAIVIEADIDFTQDISVIFQETKFFYECHKKARSKYLPLAKYMKKL